jgi:hypothetical protein
MLAHRAVGWVWLDDAIGAITEGAKPAGTCGHFLADGGSVWKVQQNREKRKVMVCG